MCVLRRSRSSVTHDEQLSNRGRVQLNEGQPYIYDRDSLVKMLDESLAQARPRR
jgi:hypothetical protein